MTNDEALMTNRVFRIGHSDFVIRHYHRTLGFPDSLISNRTIFGFMERFDLQHWTRIGVMNPLLQRKPKRQRTGAVQDLAEARKHVALACVLECGSPLALSDERFMESLLGFLTTIGTMNQGRTMVFRFI